ncbi:MAG: YggS family pyridoxal phosphate-dependent enzyme [Chloroflexota bacterium]
MIGQNIKKLLGELPPGVVLVAVAKGRTPSEVLQAVRAGAKIIGENYVQEAECACEMVGRQAAWHLIGHLQKNKVKKAVRLFDLIQTVDSLALACEIDRRSAEIGKVMPVLIEINSGCEPQKSGVLPEDAPILAREMGKLKNVHLAGLMTIGPYSPCPEDLRPYFARTRALFDYLASLHLTGGEMQHLSMGMTDSYRIAIEEGANMVRIGTAIFGART